MSNFAFSYRKILLTQQQFVDLILLLKERRYNQEEGEGFFVSDLSEDFLSAHYIVNTPTYEQRYDIEKNEIVRQQVSRLLLMPFNIDLSASLLELYGGRRHTPRIIEYIGRLLNYQIVIEEISSDPKLIVNRMKKEKISFNITRIKIKEFPLFDDIYADCNLNVSESTGGQGLIEKYSDKITQFTISLNYSELTIPITFYKNGTIVFYRDPFSLDELYKKIRNVALGV